MVKITLENMKIGDSIENKIIYRPKKIKENYKYQIIFNPEKLANKTYGKFVFYGNFINLVKFYKITNDEQIISNTMSEFKIIPNQGLMISFTLEQNEKFIISVEPFDMCTKITVKNQHFIKMNKFVKIIWDNIFIINLPRRTDRKEQMIKKLSDANITNYHFIDAVDGTNQEIIDNFIQAKSNPDFRIVTPGHYACLLSHISAIKLAKERNYSGIMILEDDVYFCDDFIKKLENLEVCEYDMLYLGGITSKRKLFLNDWILNSNNKIMGAYGYMLASHMFDVVLSKLEKLIEYVDLLYIKEIQPNYKIILLNDYIKTDLASSDTSHKSNKLVKRLNYIK